MTLAQALLEAAKTLPGESSRLEAETLLAHALGKPRAWLYAHAGDALDDLQQRRFSGLIASRCQGQPLAYLLGRREFWSLELAVSVDTLIPRPETELLVELALQRLPADRAAHVLDLGTGTGAIALALASERPMAQVHAVDASAAALSIAKKNATKLGLPQVQFLHSDWYSALAGERFDLIASNPPYIAQDDPHLAEGDLRFEPRSALASGADGLDAIRIIVAGAPAHLLPGGWLLIEHGWQQGAAMRALLAGAQWSDVQTATDLEDRDRVTLAKYAAA